MAVRVWLRDNESGEVHQYFSVDARDLLRKDPKKWTVLKSDAAFPMERDRDDSNPAPSASDLAAGGVGPGNIPVQPDEIGQAGSTGAGLSGVRGGTAPTEPAANSADSGADVATDPGAGEAAKPADPTDSGAGEATDPAPGGSKRAKGK